MGLNKTDWVFLGSMFYGIIFIMLSVVPIGSSITENDNLASSNKLNLGFHLIDNIQELPFWVNAFIFSPLVITFIYLIGTTILGAIFDGGS